MVPKGVPRTPVNAPHRKNTRKRRLRLSHCAQNTDIASLIFNQHDQTRHDVHGRDGDKDRHDDEHHVVLNRQRAQIIARGIFPAPEWM